MSKIFVVVTSTHVYATYYKTIHGKYAYADQAEKEKAINDAQSCGFRLACIDPNPRCELVELLNVSADRDVFGFLERKNFTYADLTRLANGLTKKEIAEQMDKANLMFNYSAEDGLTSYKNYSVQELLETCMEFGILLK